MPKILAVEDNPLFLESLAEELEMRGYEVLQARDGAQALDLLQATTLAPDIILSDISMPTIDGYQLLQAVRQVEKWGSIPFLFLTAHTSAESVRTAKQLGIDDYLTKPFSLDDLIVAVENKLRRQREVRLAVEHELDEDRLELMHMLSHELRIPLQAIDGGTSLLADSLAASPDEMVQEMLGFVQTGIERLNRLIKNVMLLNSSCYLG